MVLFGAVLERWLKNDGGWEEPTLWARGVEHPETIVVTVVGLVKDKTRRSPGPLGVGGSEVRDPERSRTQLLRGLIAPDLVLADDDAVVVVLTTQGVRLTENFEEYNNALPEKVQPNAVSVHIGDASHDGELLRRRDSGQRLRDRAQALQAGSLVECGSGNSKAVHVYLGRHHLSRCM